MADAMIGERVLRSPRALAVDKTLQAKMTDERPTRKTCEALRNCGHFMAADAFEKDIRRLHSRTRRTPPMADNLPTLVEPLRPFGETQQPEPQAAPHRSDLTTTVFDGDDHSTARGCAAVPREGARHHADALRHERRGVRLFVAWSTTGRTIGRSQIEESDDQAGERSGPDMGKQPARHPRFR